MKFVRVETDEGPRHGRVDGDDPGHEVALLSDAPWLGGVETGARGDLERRLAPTAPSKIVCVGRNYRAHAEELGNAVPREPLLFLKPPSALLPDGGRIEWPAASARVDFEGEVAVVVGQRLRHASPQQAAAAVFGITCANDVTARDIQKAEVQFTRAKGYDTFCPCGPWIETEHAPLDALRLQTRVDSAVRQDGCTDQMIFGIAELLSFITRGMTLLPGDLVLTGTPAGVGPLEVGQEVEVEVVGVGTLRNRVVREATP